MGAISYYVLNFTGWLVRVIREFNSEGPEFEIKGAFYLHVSVLILAFSFIFVTGSLLWDQL